MKRLLALLLVLPLLCTSAAFATDYDVVNEDIWPSQNDVAQTTGNGKKLLENQWQEAILAVTETNFVYSGCALPASSANLNISVPACQALINGRFIDIPGSTSITASASSTNHVYLKFVRDGASLATGAKFEVNTTGTAPADSVKLGTMVASGSAITSTTDMRRMGMPAVFRGPWSVGTGSSRSHEGSVTIAGNQNLSGIHFYTDFTLNSGVTITVPAGKRRVIIVASGTITINGTINASAAGATGIVGVGESSTDQAGAGGGTYSGGSVVCNGGTVQAGAGPGLNPTQVTGSDLCGMGDLFLVMGGAAGGGDSGVGGHGGASIVLIAPTIVLANTATLDTSGGTGSAGSFGGGGGGAGNFYAAARSYTDNGATFILTGGLHGQAGTSGDGATGVKQIFLY